MVYLVSYDLNEPKKNYPAIINAIGRYANPCRVRLLHLVLSMRFLRFNAGIHRRRPFYRQAV